jgi:hypothetical protein
MGHGDALPLLTPNWEKRYLPLDGVLASFQPERCAVGAIYVLATREEECAPRVEHLAPKEALLELLHCTYMNWLPDRGHRAREFDTLTQLVEQIPVRRLVPHGDPQLMGALCSTILADAETLSANPVTASQLNPY